MLGKVKFTLGGTSYELTIEEKSEVETLHKMAIFGNPPKFCHACKNNQYFRLDSHKSGEFFYNEVVCTKCGAKSTLTKKKDESFYWKKFEKWVPQDQDANQNSSQSNEDESDVPF